jgi:glycosyltransferase involved in cell wall biosynthesis
MHRARLLCCVPTQGECSLTAHAPETLRKPVLSILIPCFNEQESLLACHTRLSAVLGSIGLPYELLFINDGSRDATGAVLEALHAADAHTAVANLSRNFGHQQAVSAGLAIARGDAVVIIDADLQDPPEVIAAMVAEWQRGFHVVYGVRANRAGESRFKLWTAKLFYRVIHRLSDVPIPLDTGDFRLIDRRVVDTLLSMPERHRLLRAMCSWAGFRQTGIPYHRAARFAGITKYPLRKMLHLALDGIFSFSTVPLRMLTYAGFGAAALSFVGIVYALAVRILTRHWVAGWATLFIGVLFLSGLQMISLGIMGEYLGRVYTEVKQRPLFVVASILRAGEPGAMQAHSWRGNTAGAPPE